MSGSSYYLLKAFDSWERVLSFDRWLHRRIGRLGTQSTVIRKRHKHLDSKQNYIAEDAYRMAKNENLLGQDLWYKHAYLICVRTKKNLEDRRKSYYGETKMNVRLVQIKLQKKRKTKHNWARNTSLVMR